ncbi:hypothetical protein HHI36_014794 [Cryptolaemus montrouzieri]|uniref:Uncharacterized protein n=1 Tax=Cryptolaemus montrouzieri TaxID=559131 RepID=A0ABD2N3R8_9CUCU
MNGANIEISTLKAENMKIWNELNAMQQRLKMNELDIVGIPERKKGNVVEIMKNVSTKLNFPSVENSIDNCYRLHLASKDDKPQPIIVSFKNKLLRN